MLPPNPSQSTAPHSSSVFVIDAAMSRSTTECDLSARSIPPSPSSFSRNVSASSFLADGEMLGSGTPQQPQFLSPASALSVSRFPSGDSTFAPETFSVPHSTSVSACGTPISTQSIPAQPTTAGGSQFVFEQTSSPGFWKSSPFVEHSPIFLSPGTLSSSHDMPPHDSLLPSTALPTNPSTLAFPIAIPSINPEALPALRSKHSQSGLHSVNSRPTLDLSVLRTPLPDIIDRRSETSECGSPTSSQTSNAPLFQAASSNFSISLGPPKYDPSEKLSVCAADLKSFRMCGVLSRNGPTLLAKDMSPNQFRIRAFNCATNSFLTCAPFDSEDFLTAFAMSGGALVLAYSDRIEVWSRYDLQRLVVYYYQAIRLQIRSGSPNPYSASPVPTPATTLNLRPFIHSMEMKLFLAPPSHFLCCRPALLDCVIFPLTHIKSAPSRSQSPVSPASIESKAHSPSSRSSTSTFYVISGENDAIPLSGDRFCVLSIYDTLRGHPSGKASAAAAMVRTQSFIDNDQPDSIRCELSYSVHTLATGAKVSSGRCCFTEPVVLCSNSAFALSQAQGGGEAFVLKGAHTCRLYIFSPQANCVLHLIEHIGMTAHLTLAGPAPLLVTAGQTCVIFWDAQRAVPVQSVPLTAATGFDVRLLWPAPAHAGSAHAALLPSIDLPSSTPIDISSPISSSSAYPPFVMGLLAPHDSKGSSSSRAVRSYDLLDWNDRSIVGRTVTEYDNELDMAEAELNPVLDPVAETAGVSCVPLGLPKSRRPRVTVREARNLRVRQQTTPHSDSTLTRVIAPPVIETVPHIEAMLLEASTGSVLKCCVCTVM